MNSFSFKFVYFMSNIVVFIVFSVIQTNRIFLIFQILSIIGSSFYKKYKINNKFVDICKKADTKLDYYIINFKIYHYHASIRICIY